MHGCIHADVIHQVFLKRVFAHIRKVAAHLLAGDRGNPLGFLFVLGLRGRGIDRRGGLLLRLLLLLHLFLLDGLLLFLCLLDSLRLLHLLDSLILLLYDDRRRCLLYLVLLLYWIAHVMSLLHRVPVLSHVVSCAYIGMRWLTMMN